MTVYRIIGYGIVILAIAHICKLSFVAGEWSAKTELEVYTQKNIYYINGLEVTNELNNHVVTFNNMSALKEYIKDTTVKDNK